MKNQSEIILTVCVEVMGDEFLESDRKLINVYRRAVFYAACRELTGVSLYSIGKVIGKNHATVLHGLKIFNDEIKKDPELKLHLENYEMVKRVSKAKLYRSFSSLTNKKDKMSHILINQRERIEQLERLVSKIPNYIKMKYA